MKSINLTPTWAGVMPGLIACLENGTDKGKAMAREELMRLARAVDEHNEHAEKTKKKFEQDVAEIVEATKGNR